MAFQMSTLYPRMRILSSTCMLSRSRVVFQTVGVKFESILSSPCPLSKRLLHLVVREGELLLPKRNNVGPAIGSFNIAAQAKKFSTTATALQKSISLSSRGKGSLLCRIALGALGVTTAAAVSIHTGARVTMAAGTEKIQADVKGDWKETKALMLSLSVEERRKYYWTKEYVPLEKIPTWQPTPPDDAAKPKYDRNEKLDQKISVYSGDITKLEIDAIVNAANKSLLGGGGVDGAIHRGAGDKLRRECATLQGCETGEAKITCGYNLPAKYVIHTVGPIAAGGVGEQEQKKLRECYRNSLREATQGGARTVAFPCISTGVYGYPSDLAVHEALATVREYLEEHHDKLDRVIFCVFLPADKGFYLKYLPLYFPGAPKSKL